jgi:hypothetical protein
MPRKEKGNCKCGVLESMTDEPKCPVEFDAVLNEYHITGEGNSHWMIYYCPFCGGRTPKSRRARLFNTLTHDERERLFKLTEGYRTLDEVIAAFGQPDIDQPVGVAKITPEREGIPEITEGGRVVVYTKLSDTADVRVKVHPTGVVGFSFLSKAIKKDAG